MVELLEFQTEDGRSPFGHWFAALDAQAAVKITVALTRMSLGNFSNVEPVGAGVSHLLRRGWRANRDPVVRWDEEAAGLGYREGEGPLGRLQAPHASSVRNAWR